MLEIFMLYHLTRRGFLGSSLLLCALPARLFAGRQEQVVLRFAAMSDVHYSDNLNIPEVGRFKKALDFIRGQSNFDAVVVAGDMSDHGTEKQIGPFKKDLDEGLPKNIRRLLCMGNHEFYGGSKELWEKIFASPGNTHEVINGFHFIGISPEKGTCANGDYKYCLDWVRKELEKAEKESPDKPVFVFQHYHITGTVYGTFPDDNLSGIIDLYELFQKHPRIVNLSGHSHYPITDPRSAWQGNFTAFGTGTLSYFCMTGKNPGRPRRPPGFRNIGQFYVVEVYEDNSVVLKPYDLITDSFYDTVYTVAEPGNITKYLYTDRRYQSTKRPWWKDGSLVTVENVEPLGATFRFSQAHDDETVHSYRLSFRHRIGDDWSEPFDYHAWSYYFYKNMPTVLSVPVYCLEPDSLYQVKITPLDCFEKESESAIDAEFRTPIDPALPDDHKSEAPAANILNVTFTQSGPVNAPSDAKMKKPVETLGKPVLAKSTASDAYLAEFNGTSDAYIIRFTQQDYDKLQRRISIGARFYFKEFSQTRRSSDIFANTELGGYSFAINHQKKTLEFWLNIEGSYTVLSAALTPGEFHTTYGVYNGREAVLYLDGREVAKSGLGGKIHYPKPDEAKAFCIGGDITDKGNATNFFAGSVVFARVYGWALNHGQIKNLSK